MSGLRAVVLAAVTLAATAAHAEPPLPEDLPLPDPGRDVFSWDGEDDAETTIYGAAMARGDRHATRAAQLYRRGFANPTLSQSEQARAAIKAYAEAAAADPTAPEPHHRAASVIQFHFLAGNGAVDEPMARLAIFHWREFERLAPRDPRISIFLFDRAVTYTKLDQRADLELAVADYERLNQLSALRGVTTGDSNRLANEAEVHMMLGDLETAIDRYEQSIQLSADFTHVLGLAVALDRDRQGAKARELLRPYASDGAFQSFAEELRVGNVFFVPAAEVTYYFGLLFEVRGEPARAIQAYQQFIQSGVHPQFRARALENVAALEEAAKKGKRRPAAREGTGP